MNISISEDLLDVLIETHEMSFNIVKKYISKKNILCYEKCYHFLNGEEIMFGKIKDYIKGNSKVLDFDMRIDNDKFINLFIYGFKVFDEVIGKEIESIESKYELKTGEKNGIEECIYNYVVELREIVSHVDVMKKILKIFLEIIEKKKDDNIEDEFECCSYGETADGCPLNSMGRELGLDGFALTDSEKEVFCRF